MHWRRKTARSAGAPDWIYAVGGASLRREPAVGVEKDVAGVNIVFILQANRIKPVSE
jgi:hypothetical protein